MDVQMMKGHKFYPFLLTFLLLQGCAAGPGPPMPPCFMDVFLNLLVIGAFLWVGVMFWKDLKATRSNHISYLTEAINAMNRQIADLEKRVSRLEKDRKA